MNRQATRKPRKLELKKQTLKDLVAPTRGKGAAGNVRGGKGPLGTRSTANESGCN